LEAVGQGSTVLNFSKVDACSLDTDSFDLSAIGCNVSVAQGGEVNPIVGPSNDSQPHYVMSIFAGSAANGDALVLPPWSARGDAQFYVDVQIVDAVDVAGYDFGLSWNNQVLNCTKVAIFKPDSWPDTLDINFGINNTSDAGLGTYEIASCSMGAVGFSGTFKVATLTFLPIWRGLTPLTFFDAHLCNSHVASVQCSATEGSITVNMGKSSALAQSQQKYPVPNSSAQSSGKLGNSTESFVPNGGQAGSVVSGNGGTTIDNEQVVGAPRLDFVLVLLPFLATFGFVSMSLVWLLMPRKHSLRKRRCEN